MSISPIVDTDYRLHIADLQGEARQVVIANVTYQGVEEMVPVLHFEGQTKRLVLSAEQAEQVIRITGTPLYARWINTPIILRPYITKTESRILIQPVDPKRKAQAMPTYISEDRRGWYLAIAIVGVLLILSVLYAVFYIEDILFGIQQLRDNWLTR